MSPRVSVIVPTYRRDALLRRCLECLLAQKCAPEKYEIIVIDDGGSGATRALVTGMRRPGCAPLRYIASCRRRGPAAARNAGIAAAGGDILAFTDDDCLPEPAWIAAGVAAFADGVAGVTGRIVVPVPERPTDHENNTRGLEAAEFATANSFYRKGAVEAVGGFDERFTMPWREDADLFFSVLERFGRVVFVPEAVVVHPVRGARWGSSIADQKKSMFNALLFKKHPAFFRQRIRRFPPWNYYAGTAALIAGTIAAAAGNGAVSGGAALAWLVITAQFCRARLKRTSHSLRHIMEMLWSSALLPPVAVFWRLYGSVKFRVLYF